MKTIELSKGYVAQVDDEDFDLLSLNKWTASINKNMVYAVSRVNGKKTSMHRLLKSETGLITDHKDGNGINNQKQNLRICNRSQNGANRIHRKEKSSLYLGVRKDGNQFEASCRKNKKLHRAGRFNNEIDAARAYNDLAISLHGEFANLNKV